jgi:hypothetical protein
MLAPPADTPAVHGVATSAKAEAFALELPAEVRNVVTDLTRRIDTTKAEKHHAIEVQNFDWAAAAREREADLTRARDAILREWRPRPPDEPSAS